MYLYIAAAVVAVLLVALVLRWMQPRRKAGKAGKANPDTTISVEVALTGADAVSAQLDALTAKAAHLADMLARARRDAGLIALPVRSQTTEPRKAKPQTKRSR